MNSKGTKYEMVIQLFPLVLLIIAFEILNVRLLNQLFFAVTYCWHMALTAQNVEQKVMSPRYRLSFFKFVFVIDSFFQGVNRDFKFNLPRGVIRGISPLCFCTVMILISGAGSFLFPILSSVLYEIIFSAREQRRLWNSMFTEQANHPEPIEEAPEDGL